jgi:hypothetical protein
MAEIPQFTSLTHLRTWASKRGRSAELSGAMEFLTAEIQREALILQQRQEMLEPDKKTTLGLLREENFKDAVEHFLEEINQQLEAGGPPPPINHWTVMLYRRKAAAWAIACRIYEVENGEANATAS